MMFHGRIHKNVDTGQWKLAIAEFQGCIVAKQDFWIAVVRFQGIATDTESLSE